MSAPSFVPGRNNNDASAAFRGYLYQFEQTVLAWLNLEPGQMLELERGEDIDRITQVIDAHGAEEGERSLEQIKQLEQPVTLHVALTPELREALEEQRAA